MTTLARNHHLVHYYTGVVDKDGELLYFVHYSMIDYPTLLLVLLDWPLVCTVTYAFSRLSFNTE